jgi:hypothetical protein
VNSLSRRKSRRNFPQDFKGLIGWQWAHWRRSIGQLDEVSQTRGGITRGKGKAHEPALRAVKAKFNLAPAISVAQTETKLSEIFFKQPTRNVWAASYPWRKTG